MSVQVPNGIVDIAGRGRGRGGRRRQEVPLLLPGRAAGLARADQRLLRRAIPENRLRVYDVRDVIDTLCDEGSVLELRRAFGLGMVTALVRIEGKPFGIVANNPMHLAGAIDSDGSDKARALPAALRRLRPAGPVPVRHAGHDGRARGREDGAGAPLLAAVRDRRQPRRAVRHDRAAQGLWAGRAGDGRRHASMPATFAISWPTGEFGGMGLEGAVKLGYRKELEAIAIRPSAARCSTRWSRPPMRAARRSAPRPTSRSTR